MKLTKNLSLHEYMPSEVLKQYGDKAVMLLDKRVVIIDQALRDRYGIMYINLPGLQYRGYRPPSYYKKPSLSQHQFGRASDKHFKNISVEEVYLDILKNQAYWLGLGMTRMEDINYTKGKSTGWIHTDVCYTTSKEIIIVKP